jgi:hypothetical protein
MTFEADREIPLLFWGQFLTDDLAVAQTTDMG